MEMTKLFENVISRRKSFLPLALVSALFFFCSGSVALAQDNLGEMFCSAYENARPFGNLFVWIAYVCGALAAMRGIYFLRAHSEDPRNVRLVVPLSYLGGAACLLAIPSFIAAIEDTLYEPEGNGLEECSAGAVSAAEGLDEMLQGFIENIKEPLLSVIAVTAALCGLYMIVNGVLKASKYGTDPKTYSIHNIIVSIGFGSILLTVGTSLEEILESLFGDRNITESTAISWATLSTMIGEDVSQSFIDSVNAALTFVQLIGAISFVRGWLIMKKVMEGGASGNVTLSAGLTHILGGCLALNIYAFLLLMDATFGLNLLG